ncbi:MAG: DUF4062 domain-containing protein [Tannerella sp.]|jgi:hypothetical protein|nr:DUF4062 domain-containing protein [Tannerella sp.]
MEIKNRAVRLFVSSTFSDMNGERDMLCRYVFPRLEDFCRRRNTGFTGVDLRWGITGEDVRQGQTVRLCLSEIDHCRPYFLGILGERYGWIPPPACTAGYGNVCRRGVSVTEAEYYGEVLTPDQAQAKAKRDLEFQNMNIALHNSREEWCPEVKYPLFNQAEDEAHARMIAEIIIRYSQVPQTVTEEEFKRKSEDYMPADSDRYIRYTNWTEKGDYLLQPKSVEREGRYIIYYPDWKSFKDWCMEYGYVKQYAGKDDIAAIEQMVEAVLSSLEEASESGMIEMLRRLVDENPGENA